jgi:hypothetical protein
MIVYIQMTSTKVGKVFFFFFSLQFYDVASHMVIVHKRN